MATSAFKSTTKRASLGGSARRSLRRSRSLSRFSHPIPLEPETEADYNRNAPRGKFVNTTRGSTAVPFPEISLDDLAFEYFSSSSKNENESSNGVVAGQKERGGRSVSGRREIERWARDTASSSSRRGRSVSRTRGDNIASSGSLCRIEKAFPFPSDASSSRRRSLSVARFQISDSESEVDCCQSKSNCATVKVPLNGNCQMSLAEQTTTSGTRRLGRSLSLKDTCLLHDGYSSHSSALTDEEPKDTHFGRNGFEKIIRPIYTQKADHPIEDAANGGFYEAVRKELRYAFQEIRNELNQAIGRNHTANSYYSGSDKDVSRIREKYARKLEQRSSDRNRASKKLIEEAEKIFDDFICTIEDKDTSSFDSEICDESSTLGRKRREKEDAITIREADRSSEKDHSFLHVEMDGVILPWLQWETTSHDNDCLSGTKSEKGSGFFDSPPGVKREDPCKAAQIKKGSRFDMDEYLKLGNKDELLYEIYREQNRINSGGILLCNGGFY